MSKLVGEKWKKSKEQYKIWKIVFVI